MVYDQKEKHQMVNTNDLFIGALKFSSDGILITDGDANVIYANQAYENITGLNKDDMIGYNLRDLLLQKKFNRSVTLEVIESKTSVSTIHKYISGKSALTTANPIFSANGSLVGVINNTRNITELINLEKELEENKILAQKYSDELTLLRNQHLGIKGLIYKSKVMEDTLKFASKVAPFDTTLLITGESGTGKEVLSKFIHNQSLRKDGPFIRVNCSAIPKELFESELFGYVEGAFTGASKEGKPGMFELANNGTILLDEIGELPLHLQPKLLRVIQERELQRLGGKTTIPLDVRVISATNRDLKTDVMEGKFREDLYFRLNVVPIKIPSLRERKEDIPEIANYFLEKLNKKYNKNISIDTEAINALCSYSWPGNVRELENMVEYLYISNFSDKIYLEHLPSWVLTDHVMNKYDCQSDNCIPRLNYMLDMFEKNIIMVALNKHNSVRETAKSLDIHPSTLFRKIKKLNIHTDFKE